MAINLWESTSFNYYQSSLVTGFASGASILYLPSGASGLVAPGILTIDQYNNSGILTSSLKEYISFTTVTTGQDEVSGLTRGVAGSSNQEHTIGALIEGGLTVTHWGDLVDFIQVGHGAGGTHIIPTATMNYLETKHLSLSSLASITVLNISKSLGTSGASITGIRDNYITVKFCFSGSLSGPTVNPQTPVVVPISGTWSWVNITSPTVASAASVVFDINKNGVSIFDSGTRPSIVGGGTFVSTASLATLNFTRGDQFSWDFDGPADVDGLIKDFNIFLHNS
jgi:hypothetical protein